MIAFPRVVVVGIGLVGGSWALALRRAGYAGRIVGVDPGPQAGPALASGVLDELHARELLANDLEPGDLVVLAVPVGVVAALAARIAPALPAGAVVTDVGSAKRAVCAAWEQHLATSPDAFVGGHPMAGSHRTGFSAARADLFDGRPYFLVPAGDARSDRDLGGTTSGGTAYERVAAAVRAIGGQPVVVDATTHDRDLAITSHVPQVVAWALDAVVRDRAPELPGGSGLRDMTRLATSGWTMWADVLAANADLTLGPLNALIDRLSAARDALAADDRERLRRVLVAGSLVAAVR